MLMVNGQQPNKNSFRDAETPQTNEKCNTGKTREPKEHQEQKRAQNNETREIRNDEETSNYLEQTTRQKREEEERRKDNMTVEYDVPLQKTQKKTFQNK